MIFKKISSAFLLAVILILTGLNCGQSESKKSSTKRKNDKTKIKIGFLMETYDLNRWKRDETFFIKKAESLGAEVFVAIADGDQDRQNKQADTFLTQGIDVLVVVPKNLKTAARIVKSAHEKNVPVLAYDRLILNCNLDMYVTFDNEKVGYLQAKGVLEKVPEGNYILLGGAASDNNAKLLRKGQTRAINEHQDKTGKKITILADPYLDNWDRDEARRRVGNMITKFHSEGKKINAIIASNDSTAGGVIAALKTEQLHSRTAVSGQDAELSACQRIVEGTQTLTIYKPIRKIAETAAEIALSLGKGKKVDEIIKSSGFKINYLDNGTKKIPSIFLEPVYVTKDNIVQTIIKDDWHSLENVYKNIPKDQQPKK